MRKSAATSGNNVEFTIKHTDKKKGSNERQNNENFLSCLIHAVTRNENEIICFILTDELGKRYYFACGPDDSGEAMKRTIVNSELTLICYKDTNVVKRIDEERNLK